MTDDREGRSLEEDTARLLQAALGPEARPSPEARRQMLGQLAADMRARREPAAFPDAVVVALGGLLVLAVGVLAALGAGGGVAWNTSPTVSGLAVGLALNLAVMPIAGAVIVLRRNREQAR